MISDSLVGHLLDLLQRAPADTFLLGGGLGLQLKRHHLLFHRMRTLAGAEGFELPEARVTSDIDLFLRIEVFAIPEYGKQLRVAIDELDYSVRTAKWQFDKPLHPEFQDRKVVLDLLAPYPEELARVAVSGNRVGTGSGTDLHGRLTHEAFAVEDSRLEIDITHNGAGLGSIFVPHPYAMLNMKIRAAHDWMRYQTEPWALRQRQEPPSAKHAFDAALIVAMLTEDELNRAAQLARKWESHPIASAIRKEAVMLYGSSSSPAWVEALRQGMFDDWHLLWDAMRGALAIK